MKLGMMQSHLCIISKYLDAYATIKFLSQKETNLIARLEKEYLLATTNVIEDYRIFCLQTNKVIVSKNVKYDENATWTWEKSKAETLVDNRSQQDLIFMMKLLMMNQ